MTRARSLGRVVALAGAVLLVDQASKALVRSSVLRGERHEVLPFLDLVHVRNTGIAFGFLQDGGALLIAGTAVALVALMAFVLGHSARPLVWLPAGLLRQALEIAPIFCDQVEYHPFLDQSRLLELAREHEVLITAYSPLAHGKVPEDETLRRIGARYGKTAGQVALRWLLDQPGVSPIPKASSPERRAENFDVFDFALTDDERAEIDALPKNVRTANPAWAPDWDQ